MYFSWCLCVSAVKPDNDHHKDYYQNQTAKTLRRNVCGAPEDCADYNLSIGNKNEVSHATAIAFTSMNTFKDFLKSAPA